MKILIVGAGPTGLTTAVELARQGVIADVIDKRGAASGFSRAVGILPKSLQLLEASGVTDKLYAEGMKIRVARIFNSSGKVTDFNIRPKQVKFGHDYVVGLAQDRTEVLLRETFESLGGSVQYSCAFDSYELIGEKICVQLSDGQREYDNVVGTDGIRSQVRSQMDVEYVGYDLPDVWSIADIDSPSWPHGDSFCINLLPKGDVVIVVPIEKQRFRVISNTPDALETLREPIEVAKTHRQGQFWISIRQAETYQKGNVFLAGDAAHCHSPVGGRGMNAGIADACDLAHRLVQGGLEDYTKVRHQNGQAIVKQTERARKIVTTKNPLLRTVLTRILPHLLKLPFIKARISNVLLYGNDRKV